MQNDFFDAHCRQEKIRFGKTSEIYLENLKLLWKWPTQTRAQISVERHNVTFLHLNYTQHTCALLLRRFNIFLHACKAANGIRQFPSIASGHLLHNLCKTQTSIWTEVCGPWVETGGAGRGAHLRGWHRRRWRTTEQWLSNRLPR